MIVHAPSTNPGKKQRIDATPSSLFWLAFKYFTLLLASVFVAVPLASTLFAAFKTSAEYAATKRLTPPGSFFYFGNFVRFFERADVIGAFTNTLIVLAFSLLLVTFLGTTAAYALERFKFRGRALILGAYVLVITVPQITTQVSIFQVMQFLGLSNSKTALVMLYGGADIVSIYIFMQFIRSIPVDLDEAARMEGAGYFTIFWHIILPLMRPAIATVVILRTIYVYNDFILPFLYAPQEYNQTISLLLFNAAGYLNTEPGGVKMAGVVIVLVPTLVAFFLVQKQIYAGITQGAVKG